MKHAFLATLIVATLVGCGGGGEASPPEPSRQGPVAEPLYPERPVSPTNPIVIIEPDPSEEPTQTEPTPTEPTPTEPTPTEPTPTEPVEPPVDTGSTEPPADPTDTGSTEPVEERYEIEDGFIPVYVSQARHPQPPPPDVYDRQETPEMTGVVMGQNTDVAIKIDIPPPPDEFNYCNKGYKISANLSSAPDSIKINRWWLVASAIPPPNEASQIRDVVHFYWAWRVSENEYGIVSTKATSSAIDKNNPDDVKIQTPNGKFSYQWVKHFYITTGLPSSPDERC